jgi:hypothetical protein
MVPRSGPAEGGLGAKGAGKEQAMWPVMARLANMLWWVWLLATLVVLGYFARQGLGIMHHAGP